jgi:HEAT repeat protein
VKRKIPTLDLTEIESMEFFFEDAPAFDEKTAMHISRADEVASWMKDPDKELRIKAVSALMEASGPQASAAVISLLNDPDEQVRLEAARALGKISMNDITPPQGGNA